MPETKMFDHYIEIDSNNNVIFGWSDGPTNWKSSENAICIRNDGSYQFRLIPDGEENPVLFTNMGVPLYKYDFATNTIFPRSEEEIAIETETISTPQVTELEQVIANQYYIAAVIGINLDD